MSSDIHFDNYTDHQTSMAFVLTTTVLIANADDTELVQKVRDKLANLGSKHTGGNDDFAAALQLSREIIDYTEGIVLPGQAFDVTLGFSFPPPPKKTK